MKTFNTRFRSEEKLKDFIYSNQIVDGSDILIQIFTHYHTTEKIQKITSLLDEILPQATIIGSTTDGEILDSRVLTSNTVISFTLFEHAEIDSCFMEFYSNSHLSGQLVAADIIKEDTKAIILFSSSNELDAKEFLEAIHHESAEVIVSGALGADGGRFHNSFVFNHSQISSRGIVAVGIRGDALIAHNFYTSEWEPVGREFKITKSNGNRIYTVDKMSVYSLYEKYLGSHIAEKLPLSGLQFPFVIKEREQEHYIARSAHVNPGDGSLIFATEMKQGETVQIAFGNAEKMLQNSQKIIRDIAENIPTQALFIYASGGRRRFLQNIAHAEIEPFKQLGEVAGFFGYGEFLANTNEALFLNQSLSVLVLSETANVKPKTVNFTTNYKKLDTNLEVTQALTNIAKVSSKELQELNQKLELRVKEEVEKSRNKDSIMIHNSKLAQMGEMMSMIAHQWRQPLSAISATSTGLQVKIELGNYNEAFFLNSLVKIEEYVNHLSHTIDDFADFFKPSKKKEQTTLSHLVERALFILSSSFAKHSINVDFDHSEAITVVTNVNEVIQVLINLLKNAENVLVKRNIKAPNIQIKTYQIQQQKFIEIEDNAGGIDDAIIDKIFDSHFTTNDAENATGLGLYMSKFIIEGSCHGKLSVENGVSGAKFTICLE